MKKVTTLFFTCMVVVFAWSQDARFSVQVSTDSLLLGNYTEVTFTLENSSGTNFQAPSFEGFEVVGGPSQASSFSMINGAVTQSQSYTYYLEPLEIGNYYIQSASIETDKGMMETEPVLVVVVPNPDGIEQKPQRKAKELDLFKSIPPTEDAPKKPRKKRRIYRI